MNLIYDLQKTEIVIPGTFVNIFNVGILIIGEPGIGKSELALTLIAKNHQLIADDSPHFYLDNHKIMGKNQLPKHFLHVRGVGILDVCALFGPTCVLNNSELQLIIELETPTEVPCALEANEFTKDLWGCLIPCVRIPIIKPRNLEVIIETIAKNHLLKINKDQLYAGSLDEVLVKMRRSC